MITIATDEDNDLVIGDDGNLSLITALPAATQTVAHYSQTLLNEMIQDFDRGVPFFIVAFGANVSIQQFEAAMKARILQAPDVTGIRSFETTQEGDVLRYTATIETIYGSANING